MVEDYNRADADGRSFGITAVSLAIVAAMSCAQRLSASLQSSHCHH
jgi:hypothetical protein